MRELITYGNLNDESCLSLLIGFGSQSVHTIQQLKNRGLRDMYFQVSGDNLSKEKLAKYKMVFLLAEWDDQTAFENIIPIAKLTKTLKILTMAVIPFAKFNVKAVKTQEFTTNLEMLKSTTDSLLVISEEQLVGIHGDTLGNQSLSDQFRSLTGQFLKTVNQLSFPNGFVCVDFPDMVCGMQKSNYSFFTTGVAAGEHRAVTAIQKAVQSPLTATNYISVAKSLMIGIFSNDNLLIDEAIAMIESLERLTKQDCNIFWNWFLDLDIGESVRINVIATGLKELPADRLVTN